MAIAFRSTTNTTGLSTSLTLNKPTGTIDGDFLLVGISSNIQTPGFTPPAGWTLLDQFDNGALSNCGTWYWKIASSEGASWTWTCTNQRFAAYCIAFSGTFAAGSVINAHLSGSGGTDTTPICSAITTTTTNTMIVASMCGAGGSPGTYTPPAGMTERCDVDEANAVNITSATVAQAGTGSTGTKEFTATGTFAYTSYNMLAIAEATVNTKSVTGTAGAVTGTVNKRSNKPLSGTPSLSGSLFKRFPINLTGVISSLSGIMSSSKVNVISLAGAVGSFSGAITRSVGKALSGTPSLTGVLTKQGMPMRLTGAISSITGSLLASRLFFVAVSGVFTATGAISSTYNKYRFAIMKAGHTVISKMRGGKVD